MRIEIGPYPQHHAQPAGFGLGCGHQRGDEPGLLLRFLAEREYLLELVHHQQDFALCRVVDQRLAHQQRKIAGVGHQFGVHRRCRHTHQIGQLDRALLPRMRPRCEQYRHPPRIRLYLMQQTGTEQGGLSGTGRAEHREKTLLIQPGDQRINQVFPTEEPLRVLPLKRGQPHIRSRLPLRIHPDIPVTAVLGGQLIGDGFPPRFPLGGVTTTRRHIRHRHRESREPLPSGGIRQRGHRIVRTLGQHPIPRISRLLPQLAQPSGELREHTISGSSGRSGRGTAPTPSLSSAVRRQHPPQVLAPAATTCLPRFGLFGFGQLISAQQGEFNR